MASFFSGQCSTLNRAFGGFSWPFNFFLEKRLGTRREGNSPGNRAKPSLGEGAIGPLFQGRTEGWICRVRGLGGRFLAKGGRKPEIGFRYHIRQLRALYPGLPKAVVTYCVVELLVRVRVAVDVNLGASNTLYKHAPVTRCSFAPPGDRGVPGISSMGFCRASMAVLSFRVGEAD